MSADPAFRDGVAFVDGAYDPVAEARLPLLDMGFIRSDSCQDTISVSQGRFFRLEDHLERFERSCTRLRMTCPHDRAALRDGAPGPATERLRMLYWSKRDAGWHGTDIDYS